MVQIFREALLVPGAWWSARKAKRDETTVLRADYAFFWARPTSVGGRRGQGITIHARRRNGSGHRLRAAAGSALQLLPATGRLRLPYRHYCLRVDGVLERNLTLDIPRRRNSGASTLNGWIDVRRVAESDGPSPARPRTIPAQSPSVRAVEAIARTTAAGHGHRHRVRPTPPPDHLAAVEGRPGRRICSWRPYILVGSRRWSTTFALRPARWRSCRPRRRRSTAPDNTGSSTWTSTVSHQQVGQARTTRATRSTGRVPGRQGTEESGGIHKSFAGFFSLIVIDECHQGSAARGRRLARTS